MRATIKIFVMCLLAVATGQCGSGNGKGGQATSEGCTPASVRRCVGAWSCRGDQACSADRTWSACLCDGTGASYDASAAFDAGASVDVNLVEPPPVTPSVRYVLLDDMEGTSAPNGPIPFSVSAAGAIPGFWGGWRSSGDPSNTMTPDPYAYSPLPVPHQTLEGVTSAHAGHLACHVADLYGYCEQALWLAQGAGTSSNMTNRIPVDLSAYQGLVFWAMASKATRLKVVVENADTDALGGKCGQLDASADQCGDAFSRQVALTESWKRFEVKWSELSQDGWGHAAPSGKLDPRTIYLIGFQIDGPQSTTAAAVDADFWIDDVYLVEPLESPQDGGIRNDGSASDGAGTRCISGADELIADFQDDGRLSPADGRKGSFYVYGDSLGTFVPAKVDNAAYPIDLESGNGQCSGAGSFHTKAVGFGDWGAAISADFMSKSSGAKGTYDASKYRGVSFWARASAPVTGVKVSFPDIYTDGGADPRTVNPGIAPCVFQSGSKYNCSPYLVKLGDSDFPAYKAYQIDTTWRRFDILFADTQQDFFNPGFHTAEDKLDTKRLTSMTIQISASYVNDVAKPNDFEIWLDDVYFIK
jgi:hypothetical protein